MIFAAERKGEPMDKKRIVRPIIPKRLIYIYNPNQIRFFFWHKPEGLLIANFRFRVSYSRCKSKNLNKLHILIRSPLFCIDRNNGGTTIGNKYQLYFVKHRAERRMKMKCPEDIVSYGVICKKFPDPQARFDTYDLALKWAKMEQPANRPHYIVKCVEKFEILDEVFAGRRADGVDG